RPSLKPSPPPLFPFAIDRKILFFAQRANAGPYREIVMAQLFQSIAKSAAFAHLGSAGCPTRTRVFSLEEPFFQHILKYGTNPDRFSPRRAEFPAMINDFHELR